jgi:hypothetical protein
MGGRQFPASLFISFSGLPGECPASEGQARPFPTKEQALLSCINPCRSGGHSFPSTSRQQARPASPHCRRPPVLDTLFISARQPHTSQSQLSTPTEPLKDDRLSSLFPSQSPLPTSPPLPSPLPPSFPVVFRYLCNYPQYLLPL